jgi:hypothetical protein
MLSEEYEQIVEERFGCEYSRFGGDAAIWRGDFIDNIRDRLHIDEICSSVAKTGNIPESTLQPPVTFVILFKMIEKIVSQIVSNF